MQIIGNEMNFKIYFQNLLLCFPKRIHQYVFHSKVLLLFLRDDFFRSFLFIRFYFILFLEDFYSRAIFNI